MGGSETEILNNLERKIDEINVKLHSQKEDWNDSRTSKAAMESQLKACSSSNAKLEGIFITSLENKEEITQIQVNLMFWREKSHGLITFYFPFFDEIIPVTNFHQKMGRKQVMKKMKQFSLFIVFQPVYRFVLLTIPTFCIVCDLKQKRLKRKRRYMLKSVGVMK